nr:restriction endonuclease subunit S [Leptospira santarosai]
MFTVTFLTHIPDGGNARGHVQDGYLDLKMIKTIEALPDDQERYRLIYGDILYTEGGDKDKLGRGTIWKNEIENCVHQNHIFRARPLSLFSESKYISFFSQTKLAKDYFFKNGKQTTNLASINITILSALLIPLPSLLEQQVIVQEIESRLSVCDKFEETIQSSLKQAESLRQSILKKAFEGKLVVQDPNDEPASVLLERICAEKNTTFEKTNATSAKKVVEKIPSRKDNLIQFPRLIPEISTTDLHAGVIAMVIQAHEKQPKYLEHLGHVKCEKIAHLVESHLGISLGRTPVKDAAGPDDYPHLKKVESRAMKANYFGIKKLNIGHTYQSKHGMQKILTRVSNQLDNKDLQKIKNLIQDFMPLDKLRSEVVATLFAAWNNLLIEGKQPTNEEIIFEARENWTPEKLKIPRENFLKTLLWMRRKGYIPEGKGAIVPKSDKKTSTQKRKKGIA